MRENEFFPSQGPIRRNDSLRMRRVFKDVSEPQAIRLIRAAQNPNLLVKSYTKDEKGRISETTITPEITMIFAEPYVSLNSIETMKKANSVIVFEAKRAEPDAYNEVLDYHHYDPPSEPFSSS